ncbi:MAG: hypothetical protein LLF86_05185 [Nitrospiraceae bacterium]|nr:hypothetical protein [Nitrospiraceae bacterium]
MNIIRKYMLPSVFCITGIIFAVVLAAALVQDKKEKALQKRAGELQRSAIAAMRLKPAAADLQQLIAKADSVVPAGYGAMNPETEIFRALDNIKKIFRYSELRVSDIDNANNMVSMPLTIKSYVNDYTFFADNVSKLQALSFPFFSLSNVSLSRSKDDGSVVAEINGRLWFPAKQQAQEGRRK